MPATPSKNIFINYRRDDTGGITIAIYKELIQHFKPEHVFKDFNTIQPGSDFVESIQSALGNCNLLLVIIGKNWLTLADSEGRTRIQDPLDFVRIEIAHALSNGVKVIPVLIDNVRMPAEADLPDDLKPLVRRQSISIEAEKFDSDVFHLINAIHEILGTANPTSKMAADISQGKVTSTDMVKAESNGAYAIVCGALGLVLFMLNRGDSTGTCGFLMAAYGGYWWYKSTEVKKLWLNRDFNKSRELSRKVRLWSIIGMAGGLFPTLLVSIASIF